MITHFAKDFLIKAVCCYSNYITSQIDLPQQLQFTQLGEEDL